MPLVNNALVVLQCEYTFFNKPVIAIKLSCIYVYSLTSKTINKYFSNCVAVYNSTMLFKLFTDDNLSFIAETLRVSITDF